MPSSSREGPGSYCSWQHGPVLQLRTQETGPAQLSDCSTFTGSPLSTNAPNGAICHESGPCCFGIVKNHPHFTESESAAARLTKDGARTNVRGLTRNLESHVQIRLPPVRTVWATWRTHEEAKEMRKGAGE